MKVSWTILLAGSILFASSAQAADADELRVRAEAGDPNAMRGLCYEFLYGEGSRTKAPDQAFPWCLRAADAGIASSQTLLAEMYFKGSHIPKDEAKAREYYLLAAEQGHVHAQLMMGHLAWLSDPPELDAFCTWTRAAVLQGYEKAFDRLKAIEDHWRKENPSSARGYCDTVLALEEPPNNSFKGMSLRGTP